MGTRQIKEGDVVTLRNDVSKHYQMTVGYVKDGTYAGCYFIKEHDIVLKEVPIIALKLHIPGESF